MHLLDGSYRANLIGIKNDSVKVTDHSRVLFCIGLPSMYKSKKHKSANRTSSITRIEIGVSTLFILVHFEYHQTTLPYDHTTRHFYF